MGRTSAMRNPRALLFGGALAVVTALLVGVGAATIPDSNGVIHGCYKATDGGVRVIDPGAGGACALSEKPLDWNLQGLQGTQGIQGPQGIQGLQGIPGVRGPDGSSGYEIVSSSPSTDNNGNGTGEADCPNGKRPVMGGYSLPVGIRAYENHPNNDATGWVAVVTGTANKSYSVYAICVAATTPAS